jgi:prepilin-type N-terminal cleavage/methylation domain-containing protein
MQNPRYFFRGLTLIEMICVLTVIGVIGVTLLVRINSVTNVKVLNQADMLRRDLMHIQSLALTYGIALRLNVSTTGYTVTCLATVPPCATVGGTLIDPTTSQLFAVTFPSGLTMTGLDSSNATVDFDSIGRPSSNSTLIATNPVRTFALTGASKTSYVYLRPITGFAEVSY